MVEAVVGRLRLRTGSWRSLLRLGPASAVWALLVAILVLPIAMFLVIAVSPRLLGQGRQWFTLHAFAQVLSPSLLPALGNSVGVALGAGAGAVVVGAAMAWLEQRTDLPGRRVWSAMMFSLMLAPSYLIALGWERLLEPAGVLDVLGYHSAWLRHHFYGPLGVTVVLGVKGLPFAYLAIAGALRGLGDEFEDAARVHGGSPATGLRISASLLAPAFWSAFAIVFAESVSDFGVADTLAHDAHFPVLTYTLYTAIDAFPVDFPVAAAIGWVLLALAGLAIIAQNLAIRGRAYQVLGGRTRQVRRRHLPPCRGSGVGWCRGRRAPSGSGYRCWARWLPACSSAWGRCRPRPRSPSTTTGGCSSRPPCTGRSPSRPRWPSSPRSSLSAWGWSARRPSAAPATACRGGSSTSCCSPPWRCRASCSPPATSSPTTCRS